MGTSDGDRAAGGGDSSEAEERLSQGDTAGLEIHSGTDGSCDRGRDGEPEDRGEVGVAEDKGRVGEKKVHDGAGGTERQCDDRGLESRSTTDQGRAGGTREPDGTVG